MKNTIKVLGIISLALVIGFSVLGCKKDEDEGGGGLGLPTPASASAAPKFSTLVETGETAAAVVATKAEAQDLFEMIENAIDNNEYYLGNAVDKAQDDRFKAVYGKSQSDWWDDQWNGDRSSASYNVTGINDTDTLKALINTITEGKITGSFKGSESWSASSTSMSGSDSESGNITVDISKGWLASYSGTTRVAGVMKTEWNESDKGTRKELTDYDERSDSDNGTWKTSYTLSVTSGGKGAKFRFSVARQTSGSGSGTYDRAASDSSKTETKYSDVEVYNDADTKIFTLRGNDLTGFLQQ